MAVREPWGSRSIQRVRYPLAVAPVARAAAVLVLAVPPFWEEILNTLILELLST
jgi:hypothetical protein